MAACEWGAVSLQQLQCAVDSLSEIILLAGWCINGVIIELPWIKNT